MRVATIHLVRLPANQWVVPILKKVMNDIGEAAEFPKMKYVTVPLRHVLTASLVSTLFLSEN
jgi:hypothetical protein